jgi:hypothetical protein
MLLRESARERRRSVRRFASLPPTFVGACWALLLLCWLLGAWLWLEALHPSLWLCSRLSGLSPSVPLRVLGASHVVGLLAALGSSAWTLRSLPAFFARPLDCESAEVFSELQLRGYEALAASQRWEPPLEAALAQLEAHCSALTAVWSGRLAERAFHEAVSRERITASAGSNLLADLLAARGACKKVLARGFWRSRAGRRLHGGGGAARGRLALRAQAQAHRLQAHARRHGPHADLCPVRHPVRLARRARAAERPAQARRRGAHEPAGAARCGRRARGRRRRRRGQEGRRAQEGPQLSERAAGAARVCSWTVDRARTLAQQSTSTTTME